MLALMGFSPADQTFRVEWAFRPGGVGSEYAGPKGPTQKGRRLHRAEARCFHLWLSQGSSRFRLHLALRRVAYAQSLSTVSAVTKIAGIFTNLEVRRDRSVPIIGTARQRCLDAGTRGPRNAL